MTSTPERSRTRTTSVTGTEPRSAAIYVRISQDRAGAGLGVQRQEEDCRALCGRLGWAVVEVYADNDVSAYQDKPRKEWDRLWADVRAGRVNALAAWHMDRLTRSTRELEDLIEQADRHRLALATATGEVDLSTPTGRFIARTMGSIARYESEQKALRHKRANRQRAEQGKRAGGGLRPYGYRPIYQDQEKRRGWLRDEIVPDETEVIKEAARRLLAGETLKSILRDFRRREIKTPRGSYWTSLPLRRVLGSARISGRRGYTPREGSSGRALVDEIVSDTADWPAIVTTEVSDKLRALLAKRSNDVPRRPEARSYLLSGLLRCARCENTIVGQRVNGVRRYACVRAAGTTRCGRVSIVADAVDAWVLDKLFRGIESLDWLRQVAAQQASAQVSEPDLVAQIDRDRKRLEELGYERDDGLISDVEYRRRASRLKTRIEEGTERVLRAERSSALASMPGSYSDLCQRWKTMDFGERRLFLERLITTITVSPAVQGLNYFDPSRLSVDSPLRAAFVTSDLHSARPEPQG